MHWYHAVAAPRFESVENQPHDVNASVGDDVIIRCMTYANPPATAQWFRNGIPLDRECQHLVIRKRSRISVAYFRHFIASGPLIGAAVA